MIGYGIFFLLVAVVVLLWLRGKNGEELIQTWIATYTKVSAIRGGCVVVLVVGILFVIAGLVV